MGNGPGLRRVRAWVESAERGTFFMVDGQPQSVNVELPEELKTGVYANAARVWHTPYDFTLDFICLGSDGASPDATVVARVKVPTQVIFQIASAIAANVDNYEKQFGPITPAPPSDSGPAGGEHSE